MAIVKGDGISIGSFGVVASDSGSATIPGNPSISAVVPGDTQVALTLVADDPADTLYVRYRVINQAWSAEDGTFSRTGSGDVTVTSLSNGVMYDFTVYAKDGDYISDWAKPVRAVPTDNVVTPTALDNAMRPVALSLLTKYGKNCYFYDASGDVYDPTSGDITDNPDDEYIVKCSPPVKFKRDLVDGDLIREDDAYLVLPAKDLEFVPTEGMRVKVDSEFFRIGPVWPMFSGEQKVAWRVLIRK